MGGISIVEDENRWGNNLRYRYEHASKRSYQCRKPKKTPYQHLSTNFMAHRKLVGTTPYNEEIKHYGFEDVLLGKRFKALNANVNHMTTLFCSRFRTQRSVSTQDRRSPAHPFHLQTELKGYSNLLEMAEKLHRMHTDR